MENFNLNDDVETKEEALHKQDVDLWKNRRKMAYHCLYMSMLLLVFLLGMLVWQPSILDNLNKIESLASTIVLGFFGVIALYFGANTLSEIFANKIK